ncbi:hypothetical protein M8C21_006877 [Ambrosia artemisiifolia]|uniref:NADH:ubiquinone reductase (non-electrogenic) n=1 Tax=Ambrosia artemisiifolia TaxID=4212 RepID=A0AAD5GI17_AMBAR|nr:hypothetical protein M8C21_006877 [Ambrosia artemisiifolia]
MTIVSFINRAFNGFSSCSKILVVFSLSGGGLLAYSESQSIAPSNNVEHEQLVNKKKKVVVLGTGWASTSFLKDLDISSYDVQVVSPRNYFAFTPLLPSVTCGTVEARSIVEPIRNIIKKKNGEIQFWEAECTKIDAANKKVFCRSVIESNLVGKKEFSLDYDYLIVATGAEVNTFNTPGVMEYCHFLKEVEDAQKIRRSVMDCFEKAILPELTEEERRISLHFIIVGGGPTGVEFAAELHDFVHEDIAKLYPMVKDLVRITLIQSGDHILNTYDSRISSFAEQKFARDGIDVHTGCRVLGVSNKEVSVKIKSTGENVSVPHGMVVWSTGVSTRPVVKDFMDQIGQGKRKVLATDEWLRVKGCENVYAIGDCATIDQRKIREDIGAIFNAADKDKSGTLTVEEFQDVIDDILIRYPQVELHLQSKRLLSVTDLLKDPEGNARKEIDIEGFKSALSQVDSQMKSLPATAQVAAQQGTYLSSCFNKRELANFTPEGPRRFKGSGRHDFLPFRYKHLGQFAPLGGEQAAAELPGDWVSVGRSTQWLWYSIYASGGGLVAYSNVRPYSSVYADAAQPTIKKKKVVVLGTGWAGTSFLKNLKDPSLDVQVVSPCNYFAFTPLLPSVTVGTVEARSVVEPIRNIVKKIDTVNQKVHCKSTQNTNVDGNAEFTVDYDYLVIAMGARANTFNTPGVVENAHFLKLYLYANVNECSLQEVEDALRIRRSIIDCFERASLPSVSEDEKKRILHFVVVGGGPTGVEFAAELHDFLYEDLVKLYPGLKQYMRITLLEAGDNILNMFDKRITAFAEEKFKRDGIDVKTGSMVVKVSDKLLSLKERSSGETKDLPYGMVVWSTGIGTRPVVMDFMKQIGQGNRRVMATDEWLRVEGVPNVYALGDCATINQRRVMEDISAIFSKADKNKNGKLNVGDFTEVINDILERYPQVELHLKSKKLKNFVQLLESNQDGAAKRATQLDIEKFKSALCEVDTKMKSLPPTAQVAAQQGEYLAKCFNRMKECEANPEGPIRFRDSGRHRFKPFRYKHLGQFAPLGGEQTAAQLPGDWVSMGYSTQWLWYSVYASMLVSWRTRFLVIGDWGRRFIFGRDSSKI